MIMYMGMALVSKLHYPYELHGLHFFVKAIRYSRGSLVSSKAICKEGGSPQGGMFESTAMTPWEKNPLPYPPGQYINI